MTGKKTEQMLQKINCKIRWLGRDILHSTSQACGSGWLGRSNTERQNYNTWLVTERGFVFGFVFLAKAHLKYSLKGNKSANQLSRVF